MPHTARRTPSCALTRIIENYSGKGHGKKLLKFVVEVAESLGAAVYLETETEKLEGMYRRFGFNTIETFEMQVQGDETPGARLKMYCMRRDPKKRGHVNDY